MSRCGHGLHHHSTALYRPPCCILKSLSSPFLTGTRHNCAQFGGQIGSRVRALGVLFVTGVPRMMAQAYCRPVGKYYERLGVPLPVSTTSFLILAHIIPDPAEDRPQLWLWRITFGWHQSRGSAGQWKCWYLKMGMCRWRN